MAPVHGRALPASLLAFLAVAACGGDAAAPDAEPDNVVDPAGGVVEAAQGRVQLTVPAGALSGQTQITVVPARSPAPDPNLIDGSAYEFGPSGLQFAVPVMLELAYEDGALPAGAHEGRLRLFKQTGGGWELDSDSVTVNTVTNRVRGPIRGFSTHAILHDPCARVPLTVGQTLSGDLSSADCLVGTTYEEFFDFEVTSVAAFRFSLTGSAIHPTVGLSEGGPGQATKSVWGFASADAPGTASFTVLAAPGSYFAYVGARANTTGAYEASVTGASTEQNLGCNRAMFVAPPVSSVPQALGAGDCIITITFPADPTVDGKPTLEEYFYIKVPAGKTLTVTTRRTGGQTEFSPFPTLFLANGQVIQAGTAAANSRTVTRAAAATEWVLLGVSATLGDDGQGGRPYTQGTYALSISVE